MRQPKPEPFVHQERVRVLEIDEDQDAIQEELDLIFNTLSRLEKELDSPLTPRGTMITLTEHGKLISWKKKK